MSVMLTTPETGEKLELLSTTDVVAEVRSRVPWPKFHANYLKKLQDKSQFPAPWLEIGGRKAWLRQDLDQWVADRTEKETRDRDEEVAARYAGLTPRQLEKALADLKKKILSAQS